MKKISQVLLLISCLFFVSEIFAQQIPNGKKIKILGAITATITTTNVSYEAPGVSTDMFLNLIYVINYNGSIHLSITGGTPPYTVTSLGINNIQSYLNDAYLTNLGPGVYTINITDATGETFSTTATVGTKYPQPLASLSNIIFPSNCSNADGSFTINASGGTPPYTYSIDGGNTFSTNNIFTGLTQGVYPILLVKDANGFLGGTGFNPSLGSGNYFTCNTDGCCSSNFYVYAPQPITCSNNSGSIEAFYGTGNLSLQFSIDGINYFAASPQIVNGVSYQYTFTNLAPGLYHVYAKYNTGEISQQSISIIKGCGVSLSPVTTNPSCQQNNGSINAVATDGTSPYFYSIDGINFQTSNVFNNLSAGLYYLWVKDANGFMGYAFATLFDQCPKVTASETDESCNQKNGTITATAYNGTSPYQYSIDGINFQTISVFNDLSAGNYIVTVKDAGNFTNSFPITINDNCLQLAFSVINTTCSNNNGSIAAKASGGTAPYQYSFMQTTGYVSSNLFTGLTAGTYTIFAKDANGITTNANVTLTDTSAPKINVGLTQSSCTNTNGSININASGGTSPFQFSIDNGTTFQSSNIFNNLDSAQYIALIKDANGCIVDDTVQLTALPTPIVFLGNDTTLCTNETLLLNTPQAAGNQYLWQDNSTANTFIVTKQGIYSVKVTNQFGCSASSSINVHFNGVSNFTLGADTIICNGKSILLQPSVVLLQANYLWNTGSTSFSINTNTGGLYWLQVSNGGCIKRDSIMINIKANPIINLGNDTTLCAGQTLLLDATNNDATYNWQDGSTQPTFIINNPGVYSVDVIGKNGCDTSGKISVNYITKPVIDIGKDTSVCITQNLLLDASYPQSTYTWQDGSTKPQFNVMQAGAYFVDVSNICGDTKDSINVVYENCTCKFYIPSAFSPNKDGKNDIFIPKYQCLFSNYELKIFNRWGQMVFNSTNVSNGWNGNFNNLQQPTGSYVWQLNYKDNLTGKQMYKTGTVVLVR